MARSRSLTVAVLLTALLLTTFSTNVRAAQPGIEVQVKTSKTLSLLYFARGALRRPHISPRLAAIWQEHADEDAKQALQMVASALEAGPGSVQYFQNRRDRPPGRHLSQGLDALLEVHAGAASDLDDFSRRITGLLPVSAHARLIEGLEQLQAIHDEHVWKPSRAFLRTSRRTLERLGDRYEVERRFGQVARFYGANWPDSIPITIYLVPVPGDVKQTHGHSAGAIEVAEVLENDNLESRFAVLFHEMCHSLYAAQPLGLQNELAGWFDEHPLPIAAVAYGQLNEGLATALGNGWMEHAIRGEAAFEDSWYADDVIDGFSRSLYPLVNYYLEHDRTLDQAFVNRAVALFAWKFPGAMDDPRLMFRRSLLLASGGFDVRELIRVFEQTFDAGTYGAQPISHDRTRAGYDSLPHPTVFIIGPENLHELNPYPFGAAAKKELSRLFETHDAFVWVTRIGDGRKKVFVAAPDQQAALAAFRRMTEVDRLPDDEVLPVTPDQEDR